MTACRYARVPSSGRITVVSMCQSSSGRLGCTPTLASSDGHGVAAVATDGAARGCTTSRATHTRCRAMSRMACTSVCVNRCGEVRGHEERSPRVHARCRRHACTRLAEIPKKRSTPRRGTCGRACSMARSIRAFASPSGSRVRSSLKPDAEPKVPGVLDEVPEAMVVALLRTDRCHAPIMTEALRRRGGGATSPA